MNHGEFIKKIKICEAIETDSQTLNNEELAQKYFLKSGRSVASQLTYLKRHEADPRWPVAEKLTHARVLWLSGFIDLSDMKKARKILIGKFQESSTSPFKNKSDDFGKKWMQAAKLCGLNCGMVGDKFVVHWNEKP